MSFDAPSLPPAELYNHTVQGTAGSFSTPAGTVRYILCKARIGAPGENSLERQLSLLLRPVRELLTVQDLSFSQLLQRDLDDTRVATELVPYVLGLAQPQSPSFFPPVTAVLLPFEDDKPLSAFVGHRVEDSSTIAVGEAMKVELDQGGAYARLRWNETQSKLVVLDGQHRAMALLAIARDQQGGWSTSPKYSVFYEDRVKALLASADTQHIWGAEMPVTVCWFEAVDDHQAAARSLFYDLNQHARKVSPSRVILVGEGDFVHSVVRRCLDEIKAHPTWQLAAVEYDSPHSDVRGPQRWSAFTNVTILELALRAQFAGKWSIVSNLRTSVVGWEPSAEARDAFMRDQLALDTFFPGTIEDDGREADRDELGRFNVPAWFEDRLTSHAWLLWGRPVTKLLFEISPAAWHRDGLEALYGSWQQGAAVDALAHEAIFEGTGLFWLLQGDEHLQGAGLLAQRHHEFTSARTSATGMSHDHAEAMFRTARLLACQYGLTLTFSMLAQKIAEELFEEGSEHAAFDRTLDLADRLIAGLNAVFDLYPTALADFRIPGGLEARAARFFRCRWLELLNLAEARVELGETLGDAVGAYIEDARELVISEFAKTRERVLKEEKPEQNHQDRQAEATAWARMQYADELVALLGYSRDDARLALGLMTAETQVGEEGPMGTEPDDDDDPEDE